MASKRQLDPFDWPLAASEPAAAPSSPKPPGTHGNAQALALQRLRKLHVTRVRKLRTG
jgi:hypothetical protein